MFVAIFLSFTFHQEYSAVSVLGGDFNELADL